MASDYIKRHKSWQKYANKEIAAGRKPVKFKYWMAKKKDKKPEKTESVYFRGIKRESDHSRLKKAGLSDKEIERMSGKSSKYKRNKK